jgi:DNA-binding PucR family transcriptional regulator
LAPLGARDTFTVPAVPSGATGAESGIRFAFGAPGADVAGFRRTHLSGPRLTSFAEVAPLALMASSVELLRAWVLETLGSLAADDDQHARLRDTLGVFLQENGSYKATAERRILHKNSVQYRIHKTEEALGHPVDQRRLDLELALLASHWLGATVLQHPDQPGHG